MSHSMLPKTVYTLITVRLAVATDELSEVTDGLNEMLNAQVDDGFIGDYAIDDLTSSLISSGDAPEEGDFFNGAHVKTMQEWHADIAKYNSLLKCNDNNATISAHMRLAIGHAKDALVTLHRIEDEFEYINYANTNMLLYSEFPMEYEGDSGIVYDYDDCEGWLKIHNLIP